MNTKYLIALLGIISCSFLTAQISVNFTADEGYSDGALGSNADWSVWDGSGSDPNTYTLVATGSAGALIIDPTESAFQAARYVGKGSALKSNSYYGESTFILKYANGTSSIIPEGPLVLPLFEFQNTEVASEAASFGLRHVKAQGTDGNRFNIFSFNKFNGSGDGNFSSLISGRDLGLAIDSSGNWTDGQSDTLTLTYALVYKGGNEWSESVTLTNDETATKIATISRTVTDKDDSFAANESCLRLYAPNATTVDVAIVVGSINVAVAPE